MRSVAVVVAAAAAAAAAAHGHNKGAHAHDTERLNATAPAVDLPPCSGHTLHEEQHGRWVDSGDATPPYSPMCPFIKVRYNCVGARPEVSRYRWVPDVEHSGKCGVERTLTPVSAAELFLVGAGEEVQSRTVDVLMLGHSHVREQYEGLGCRFAHLVRNRIVLLDLEGPAENVTLLASFKGRCTGYGWGSLEHFFTDPPPFDVKFNKTHNVVACKDHVSQTDFGRLPNGDPAMRVTYLYRVPVEEVPGVLEAGRPTLTGPSRIQDFDVLLANNGASSWSDLGKAIHGMRDSTKAIFVMTFPYLHPRAMLNESLPEPAAFEATQRPHEALNTLMTEAAALDEPDRLRVLNSAEMTMFRRDSRVVNPGFPDHADTHLCLPGVPDDLNELFLHHIAF